MRHWNIQWQPQHKRAPVAAYADPGVDLCGLAIMVVWPVGGRIANEFRGLRGSLSMLM